MGISLILGFLKMWWKPLLVGTVAVFAYWKVDNLVKDYKEMVAERDGRITTLVVQRNTARIEAETTKAVLAEQERHEERMELLLAEIIERQDTVREEKQAQQEVFEGHDLEEMAKRHGQWIEKLANKATRERMDAFENAFNR